MKGGTEKGAHEFADRVRLLVDEFGLRPLARSTGISVGALRNWLAGGEPKLSHLLALRGATDVNLEWLVAGRGPMRDGNDQNDGEFVKIPRYDVYAAGGHGAEVLSENIKHSLAFRRDWLIDEGFGPAGIAAIGLRGESQAGLVNHKDVCLLDLRYTKYVGEGLYAIRIENDLLIKIIQHPPGGGLRIISRNDNDFPPFDIAPDQVHQVTFVGCVGWSGGSIPRPRLPRELV